MNACVPAVARQRGAGKLRFEEAVTSHEGDRHAAARRLRGRGAAGVGGAGGENCQWIVALPGAEAHKVTSATRKTPPSQPSMHEDALET